MKPVRTGADVNLPLFDDIEDTLRIEHFQDASFAETVSCLGNPQSRF